MAKINAKVLAAGVAFAALVAVPAIAAKAPVKTDEAMWATPEGITMQPLGKAQGYDLGKQTAAFIAREQIAYADTKGMTLYTYDKDQPGKSNCVDDCLATWHPMPAVAGAKPYGAWSIITRADGTRQWALSGKPLYTYAKDLDPGSVAGNDPARFGARRLNAAGQPVGGGVRGSASKTAGADQPVPDNWKVALVFPLPDIKLPDGLRIREVPDANGLVLVNYRNQTLYAFSGDPAQDHQAAKVWMPVAAPQLADAVGDFGFAMRPDGIKQWTYKGKALYTYANDFSADDAYGIGVDKQWDVAAVVRYYVPPSVEFYNTPGQGKILATAQGMTLYKRDGYILQSGGGHSLHRGQPQRPAVGRDIGTNALCDADCTKVWHPFVAPAEAQARGFWDVIARPDGTKQWTYQGYALWTYDGDKKPGDMNGNDSLQYAFADTPSMKNDAARTAIDLGTPTDGAPALYWAIAIP